MIKGDQAKETIHELRKLFASNTLLQVHEVNMTFRLRLQSRRVVASGRKNVHYRPGQIRIRHGLLSNSVMEYCSRHACRLIYPHSSTDHEELHIVMTQKLSRGCR